ncbi:hypothetical protein BDW59DRAFT_22006 [Aspergillus cavernicola]|uniref:Uncharacterized protein n=1 Tax=Aspergillus cavernicola TaxID=176166 RepID=A0ABR4IQY6_9EURO
MQAYNDSEVLLVAPGPAVPMYRPSSQPSKRTNYTMSALAPKYQQYLSMADDIQSPDTFTTRPNNENATEVVRFFQTHTASQENTQSTGAREMIKAGQRRLRLALRNKKTTELKSKADDASRQLAALHQGGGFPRSQQRRAVPVQKKRAGSITSTSKSVSNLSFKSNSKRDVETIGQPWLENPLETRDAPGSKGSSQLSSLDLHDLASFVEATVNFSSHFDDPNSPPYLPPTEHSSKTTAPTTSTPQHVPQFDAPPVSITSAPGNPKTGDTGRKGSNELPASLPINFPTQSNTPIDKHNSTGQLLEKPKPREDFRTGPARLTPPGSSASSKSSSTPTTPVLKLFPDTMPPRVSSRGALRIPTVRSPNPHRSISPTPGSQRTTAIAAVFESKNRDLKNPPNGLPNIQETASNTLNKKQDTSGHAELERYSSPSTVVSLDPEVTQVENDLLPSSLTPDAIDAFPIPAPIRPLPSAPQPVPQIRGFGEHRSAINRHTAQVDSRGSDPEPRVSTPPYISVSTPSGPGNGNSSLHGGDSSYSRVVTSARDPVAIQYTTAETAESEKPRRGSLGKNERSREDKVRSVIMRDLAASRHPKGSNKSQITETQPSEVPRGGSSLSHRGDDSRLNTHRQYQRKVSPGPQSPPPMSPPPSNPPRQPPPARRYCTSPAGSMATITTENYEKAPRPVSNRNARVYRQSAVREVEPNHERAVTNLDFHDRFETPLPSSDDEGPSGDFYWNPSQQKASGRRQRPKPAPIIIDEPTSRGRSLKKHQVSSDAMPPTPQSHRRRGPEKAPHAHDHHNYDSYNYHVPEPKANPSLEGRIEHLERQNKILQAALLAALDVGVKQDLSSLLGASATSLSTNITPPLTGRSFSSTTNASSVSEAPSAAQDRRPRNDKAPYRPDSWMASTESFRKSNYESDDSAETREFEEMIDEFDIDWLSDHSGVVG